MKNTTHSPKINKSFYNHESGFPPSGGRKGGFPFGGIKGGLLFLIIFLPPLWGAGGAFAQTWQWGVSGGSATHDFGGDALEETVTDMDVDQNGNTYIVSQVGATNFDVEGVTHTFFGEHNYTPAALIASFDCDGNYLWSKLISGYSSAYATAVRTDSLGNVYVAGGVSPSEKDIFTGQEYLTHFGADTVIPYSPNPKKYKKRLFLARYDTAGNFEQLIMPQSDSITSVDASTLYYYPLDMVVDPNGTQHWFMRIREEYFGNPHTPIIEGDTLQKGYYLLKYNDQGNYLGNIKLEMLEGRATSELLVNHDPVSGAYYLTGQNYSIPPYGDPAKDSLWIGGQPVLSHLFVAKFDSLGQNEWLVQSNTDIVGANRLMGRPQIDNQGNIYLSGNMQNIPNPVNFNGYTDVNQLSTGNAFPMLIKIDSNGNLLWGTGGETNNGVGYAFNEINGNKVAFTGDHAGIVWGSVTFSYKPNSGYDTYLARFDKQTGAFIAMDSIGSNFGYDEAPSAIAAGPRGNVYIGGEFESQMYIGNSTLGITGSDGTDFFVAKFGQANCNCALPQAKFTFSGNGNGLVNYTYTGTPGYTELEWGFGNGTTTTTATGSASQTYAADEEYWVCVTAYNSCGYDTWCTMVEPFKLNVAPLSKNTFQAYPNPVQNLLYIGAAEPLSYRLFSITGKELLSGKVQKGRNSLSVGNLRPGFYMLVLENGRGQKGTVKLVKE